jgi:hypothetical protein
MIAVHEKTMVANFAGTIWEKKIQKRENRHHTKAQIKPFLYP